MHPLSDQHYIVRNYHGVEVCHHCRVGWPCPPVQQALAEQPDAN